MLATFTAEGAATTLQVIGTITIQTGCPSSFRAYQTIELGPSLSCFAEPVVLTMGNVTNVQTVTYTYQECPVITDAVSPTITVVRHLIRTFLTRRMSRTGYRPTRRTVQFSAQLRPCTPPRHKRLWLIFSVTLPSRASSAVAVSSLSSESLIIRPAVPLAVPLQQGQA